MASTLQELFSRVGIDPTRPQRSSSAGDLVRSSPLAAKKYVGDLIALDQVRTQAQPVSTGNSKGFVVDSSTSLSGGTGSADGGGWSFKDALGDVFTTAIRIIDTPRALVVSTIKEVTDAVEGEGFSWSDWANQALSDHHIGFGEVVQDWTPGSPMWLKRGLGFIGDVGLDPMTYVGAAALKGEALAGKTATAADKALLAAAKQGGRESIAKALSVKAAEVGLEGDAAVARLISTAAKQGRGALTERALMKAGLDDAALEALGLPRLAKTFMGKEIPMSGRYAQAAEGMKGAVKETLGRTGAAKFYRTLRVSEANGRHALLEIMRTSADPEKVAAATGILHLSQNAARIADSRVDMWTRTLKDELSHDMRRISKESALQATDDLERGLAGAMVDDFRKFYATIHTELKAAGVDVQWIDNYVPHISTFEARQMARGDKEVARWVKSINDSAFFENRRTLTAGTDFFGHTVPADATVKWFNDVSMAEKGIKFFEDDIRDITSIYMGQAREALYRANLEDGLVKSNFAMARPFKTALTPQEKALFDDLIKVRKQARADMAGIVTSGAKVRRDMVDTSLRSISVKRAELTNRMRVLRQKADDLGRGYNRLLGRAKAYEDELPLIQAELDSWTSAAKTGRKSAQAKARREVTRVEGKLAAKQAEMEAAKLDLQKFVQENAQVGGRPGNRLAAGGEVKAMTLAEIQQEAKQIADDLEKAVADHETLKMANTPLGEHLMVPAEVKMAETVNTQEWVTKRLAEDQVAAADARLLFADTKFVLRQVEADAKVFDDLYAKMRFARKKPNVSNANMLRDETNRMLDIFSDANYKMVMKDGTPATDILFKQEALAIDFDLKAMAKGDQINDLTKMIDTMAAPGFGSKIVYEDLPGWTKLGEQHAIPGWAEDALALKGRLKDPEFFPNAAKYMKQFENLWKGWATARPGFIVRNAYSSLFNVYLEAGVKSVSSMKDFFKFVRIYHKNPTEYLTDAAKIWDAETVKMLDEALSVIPATGGGISAAEFHTDLLRPPSANPLKPEFAPIYGMRHANENLEAWIRGGHAYDVIRRGGSADMAVDVVSKWHFNYRDITEFDRAMKHVIPFWAFFSNNIALQAHVWTGKVSKLNRTYFNAMRNMGLGQPDEQGMPEWQARQMGLPLGVNPQGTSSYLVPGLPSIQFAGDVQGYVDRPTSVLSNLGPLAGLPLEAVAGKNFFTGDDLSGYRDAGLYGSLGLGAETGSGGRALTPFQLHVLNGLLPGFSTANRLSGGTSADSGQAWLSWLGVSTSKLTPEQRLAQARREAKAKSAAEYKRKVLEHM